MQTEILQRRCREARRVAFRADDDDWLLVAREDAEAYMLLGYALAMQGQRRADGLAYLERARTMQPGWLRK